jgi:hypothetical protein
MTFGDVIPPGMRDVNASPTCVTDIIPFGMLTLQTSDVLVFVIISVWFRMSTFDAYTVDQRLSADPKSQDGFSGVMFPEIVNAVDIEKFWILATPVV